MPREKSLAIMLREEKKKKEKKGSGGCRYSRDNRLGLKDWNYLLQQS